MNPIRAAYLAVFGLATIACFVGAWRATDVVDDDTRTGLFALLVLSGAWGGASVGRLLPLDPTLQATFYVIGLVCGFATVGAWLYFCSAYTGSGYHRRPTVRVTALVVFLVVVSVKLTNPLHGQYFATTVQTEPFRHLAIEYHAIHWVVTGLAYALSAVGFYLLYELFDQSHYDTTGLGVLVALTGVPVIVDVVAYTEVAPGLLLKFNFEPIGVAVFAIGALYVVDETFVAVPRFWRQDLLDHLDEAIVVLDQDDHVRDYNVTAADLFPGLPDMIGESVQTGLPELASGLADDDGVMELDRGDETAFYRLRSVSLADGSGGHRGRVVICADVTEVERQRRELARQTEQFDDFAEATTHELRNTVTLIDGYLDLVAERVADGQEETEGRPIDRAADGVDRMRSVIADLTTLVRYSRPPETLRSCDVRAVVDDGYAAAGVDELHYQVEGRQQVQADEQRVTELFAGVFEFAAANGAARATVAVEDGAIVVTTDGPSLSARGREKAFAYGEPVPSADAGMALPNVRMLARALGWTSTIGESDSGSFQLRFDGVTVGTHAA